MAKPRTSLDMLNWSQIREEYETTPIPIRQLARRWGIASENTLRRRRDYEGWNREQKQITANLVTAEQLTARVRPCTCKTVDKGSSPSQAPADSTLPPTPALALTDPSPSPEPTASPSVSPGGYAPQHLSDAPVVGDHSRAHAPLPSVRSQRTARATLRAPAQTTAQTTAHTAGLFGGTHAALPPPEEKAPIHVQTRVNVPPRGDEENNRKEESSRRLAGAHSAEILEQLRYGAELVEIGRTIAALMQQALTARTDEEVKVALTRLIKWNPRGGLASSAAAAQSLIERGMLIRRRALGMDVIKGGSVPTGRSHSGGPKKTAAILKRLKH